MTETAKPKRTTKTPSTAATKAAAPAKKVAEKVTTAAAKPEVKAEAKPVKAAAPKKAAPAKAATKSVVDADLRQKMLVDTAYYVSQHRHNPQGELNDWLFAEALVDGLIAGLKK